jgi:DNA polymerases epsilon N terminal
MNMEEHIITRRSVTRAFKVRGLTLQAAALDGMMSVLAKEKKDDVLKAVLDALREHTLTSASSQKVITKELLATVVADLSRNAKDVNDEALQLLNAFETPRLHYDTTRKQFTLMTHGKEKRSLFGDPDDKVSTEYSTAAFEHFSMQKKTCSHAAAPCYNHLRLKCSPNVSLSSSNESSDRTCFVPNSSHPMVEERPPTTVTSLIRLLLWKACWDVTEFVFY